MGSDALSAVQAGIYARLAGYAPLTALLAGGAGGIYDYAPLNAAFPHVIAGEAAARAFGTQDSVGMEVAVAFHVYSRAKGGTEARDIIAALAAALDGYALSLAGHRAVSTRHVSSELRMEADGLTRHGTVIFDIITEPL
jgi:Protein of unknown function (DUF3168)